MRVKYLMILILSFFILFIIPYTSNATDTFTTEDGITATKIVESTGGNIDFKFTNIPLEKDKNYVWGLSRTSSISGVEKWFSIGDYNYTNKTANITLVLPQFI